jgi:integrase
MPPAPWRPASRHGRAIDSRLAVGAGAAAAARGKKAALECLSVRVTAETARRRIQLHAAAIGLPHVKPHDLRRFVGTQLTEKFRLRQAQLALEHASPDVTARFYVLDELQDGLTDDLY